MKQKKEKLNFSKFTVMSKSRKVHNNNHKHLPLPFTWSFCKKNDSSIHLFFCGKSSGKTGPTWRHITCSWKKKDVGYCGRLTGVRGRAFLGERGGLNKKGLVLENGGEHWSVVITKKQMQRSQLCNSMFTSVSQVTKILILWALSIKNINKKPYFLNR